jgi:hypothetical protein
MEDTGLILVHIVRNDTETERQSLWAKYSLLKYNEK